MKSEESKRAVSLLSSVALSAVIMMLLSALAIPFLPAARGATNWNVSIVNFAFQQDSLAIMPGDTVIWTNNADRNHDVTEASDAWTSGPITPGNTFSKTFDTVGDVNYYCSLHPSMTAVIHVGTQIPEFSGTFLVVLGMLGMLIGVVVIRKRY